MASALVIFDDGRGRFGPLTHLRAAFELRSGAHTTLQRIERTLDAQARALWTRREHAAVAAARHRGVKVNELPEAPACLFVNGRWLGIASAAQVRSLEPGEYLIQHDGQLIAAHVSMEACRVLISSGFVAPPGVARLKLPEPAEFDPADQTREAGPGADLALIERPWHILDQLESTLRLDLAAIDLPEAGRGKGRHEHVQVIGDQAFKVAPDAQVRPYVVVDTTKGQVVVDHHADIRPFTLLSGPCYIGEHSVVNPHSDIRPRTVIGPRCKVGGEVNMSILHSHSNKAHAGYLGHALVGQWVNLGGDTNVSNLKNTYGPVRVQLEKNAPAEDSGRTFLGPIIGDYTLTAIGSRILSGSCINTATMLAVSSFAPKFTEAFSFITDDGESRYDFEKFLDLARRMMSRRGSRLSEAEEEVLRALCSDMSAVHR
ncbi:MAG: putative sugar nucleotidyl transferase [Phycisphaeraceae bacterium]